MPAIPQPCMDRLTQPATHPFPDVFAGFGCSTGVCQESSRRGQLACRMAEPHINLCHTAAHSVPAPAASAYRLPTTARCEALGTEVERDRNFKVSIRYAPS